MSGLVVPICGFIDAAINHRNDMLGHMSTSRLRIDQQKPCTEHHQPAIGDISIITICRLKAGQQGFQAEY